MFSAFDRWRQGRRQRRDEAARRWKLGCCKACGHHWSEHAGSGNDLDGICGECAYEIEHDQRTSTDPGCSVTAPASYWRESALRPKDSDPNLPEPRLAIKRPFSWGILLVLDRRTDLVPEIDADSIVTASDEGLAIAVHHAADTASDGFEPDEVVPPAEVEVRIYVDTDGPDSRAVEVDISVPSGTLTVGDAEQEHTLDIGVGRWHVQVVCTPWRHADEVDVWIKRAEP